jgi:hypothetical protein
MHDFSELDDFWTEQIGDAVVMGDSSGKAILSVQHASAVADLLSGGLHDVVEMDPRALRALVNQMAERWKACAEALEALNGRDTTAVCAARARAILQRAVQGEP